MLDRGGVELLYLLENGFQRADINLDVVALMAPYNA